MSTSVDTDYKPNTFIVTVGPYDNPANLSTKIIIAKNKGVTNKTN